MKTNLFKFAWKEVARSPHFGKSIATKIFLGFLALYFALNFTILGFVMPKILADAFPNENPVSKFNSFLLIYFGIDLLVRQMMQALPTISFKPFIILDVKRKEIANYLLIRSVFHFFNFLPYFLLIPVSASLIFANYPVTSGIAWLAALAIFIFTNHFLAIYIKWWTNENDYGFYIFIGVLTLAYAIDYFGIIDLNGGFGKLFDFILVHPVWIIGLLIFPIAFYLLNYSYLLKRLYLNLVAKKQKDEKIRDFGWLNRFGDYAKFISLDMRLIWRNKRPRSQFMITIVFLAYGFLIYKGKPGEGIPEFIMVLGGLLMVSMFSISFGQFFPAWHSSYFNMLMTQNFRMKQFLQSFYFLNLVVCVVYYLITLGYGFMDTRILYYHSVMLIYHIGVNMNLIFLFGLWSSRGMDLSGSSMFNYQGMGATQWLFGLPAIFLPVLLFALFSWLFTSTIALGILATLGLIGMLSQPYLFQYFTQKYLERKHKLIRNYKNS